MVKRCPILLKNKAINKKIKILLLVSFNLTVLSIQAQLGFCTGNSGDPIFTEDFGIGNKKTSIPSGSTTYKFTHAVPSDGNYNVSNSTNGYGWFNIKDHTPKDDKGRMLVVNAGLTAGEFYRININGLCENTTYEFSSWLINLLPRRSQCPNGGIPINVKFEIWDSTDTNLLASGNTGNIRGTSYPDWKQYGLVFQTIPKQTSVILKMRNNGKGGCGNDLAIDDIVFKTCGDAVILEDASKNKNVSIYNDVLPYSTTLKATPDFSVFSTHFYQWQKSENGIN